MVLLILNRKLSPSLLLSRWGEGKGERTSQISGFPVFFAKFFLRPCPSGYGEASMNTTDLGRFEPGQP